MKKVRQQLKVGAGWSYANPLVIISFVLSSRYYLQKDNKTDITAFR